MVTTRNPGIGAPNRRSDANEFVEALEEIQQLDASGLRRRWRSLVGAPLPQDLGRPLILRMLAYKLQAKRLGDLDKASQRELVAAFARSGQMGDERRSEGKPSDEGLGVGVLTGMMHLQFARPGTILSREHNGIMHRVMILEQGVTWNGKTYESLSKVASAITGTRWNGPRFFGLRYKGLETPQQKPKAQCAQEIVGRGRAIRMNRFSSRRPSS